MGVTSTRSAMVLFSDPESHLSHRVRIVLAEKGITADIEEMTSDTITEELADLNPYGTLPTLADRDLALYETKVMMEYLDERFPHPPLLPVYPVARAMTRLWMYRIEKEWSPLIEILEGNGPEAAKKKARKELCDSLVTIAPIFTENPYFLSEEFSLVDCCFAPILWRLKRWGIELPTTRAANPIIEYMKKLFSRKSFRQSLTQVEREMNL